MKSLTVSGKLSLIYELSQMTIRTGKRGRPKKLYSKKDLKEILKYLDSKGKNNER